MAHKNVGRGAHGFCTRRAQHFLQRTTNDADDPFHQTDVVKHGNERRKEDDDGEHLQCKRESHALGHKASKQERNARIPVGQQLVHPFSHGRKQSLTPGDLQHKRAQAQLNGKRTQHRSPRNGRAVSRKRIRQSQKDSHAHNAHQHAGKLTRNSRP